MKQKLLCTLLSVFFCIVIVQQTNAQVAAIPFTASLDTFAAIAGTTIDAPNADDVVYQNLPIGFNFNLGGTMHDKMSISTNGNLELDSTGSGAFFSILSGQRNNIIAPFGADLIHHNTNASLQYLTTGTAPNRVCIVQWLHYSYFGGQGDINFQAWLYESSNCIRFVYGANSLMTSPLQTQIGLRGTTNLDFIVLGDTACSWANAYPFPTITTMFPVSMMCSMPSGFAFHFGYCGGNTVNFGYLTGKVYNDLNGNGNHDTGEMGIGNHVVNIIPGNYFVSSDANGDYTFFFTDSTLTYSISTGGFTYWNQTNIPAVISCNPLTQSCSGLDLGFQQIPNVHEVSITCPNWAAKPGQPEPMPIFYHNNGTVTESDTIVFVMDSLYSFINSIPAPTSVSGQTITWTYTNLQPNAGGSIMLHLLPSATAVLGDTLYSDLSIGPLNDTVPANNSIKLNQLLSNSWDPNDKLAEPSGMIEAGTVINYTVHFQNTGNAAAANVIIKDTLDSNLDLLSFHLIGASHQVNFKMEGNTGIFTFYNIQLPDSGSNFAGSNGYVSFSLRAKAALAPLTVINNSAGIIFDSNPAIITNITADTIRMPLAIDENIINTFYLNASPNPTNGNVVFAFSKSTNEQANLVVSSLEGKVMFTKNNITSHESISLNTLPAGVYFCTVTSATATRTVKIVKQ